LFKNYSNIDIGTIMKNQNPNPPKCGCSCSCCCTCEGGGCC